MFLFGYRGCLPRGKRLLGRRVVESCFCKGVAVRALPIFSFPLLTEELEVLSLTEIRANLRSGIRVFFMCYAKNSDWNCPSWKLRL